MSENQDPPAFEDAIDALEKIVERMESGELSLEDSLGAFEEGIRLTRTCQRALEQAELRVEQLLGNGQTVPFQAPGADGENSGDS